MKKSKLYGYVLLLALLIPFGVAEIIKLQADDVMSSGGGAAADDVPEVNDFGNLDLVNSNFTGILNMARGGILQVNATGHGFFALFVNIPSATAGTMSITGNQVRCWVTYMDRMVTTDRAFMGLVGTGAAGCEASVGLFDTSGAVIRKSSVMDCTAGGGAGVKTLTFTEYVATGTLLTCATTDDATATFRSIATNANTSTIMNNSSTSMIATAANPSVQGVLPDTLGALSDSGSDTPLIWFTK